MSKAVFTFWSLLVALAGIVSVLGQEDAVTVPCQSGSAVKVGIPWPDSKEPLSSLEYTLDGLSKTKIPLDGTQAITDNDGGTLASKRFFQNVLRSSESVSSTRANCKETSVSTL